MKSIEQLALEGARVFIRVDFNVPIKNGRVTDATRIRGALETVRHARGRGAKVILASHLGRPDGRVKPELTLGPAAHELAAALETPVELLPDCVGPIVQQHVAAMAPRDVVLLENLRFHAEEEANDAAFSRELASLCDVYVNDAFGTAHRAHASTAGIVEHACDAAAGFLLFREVRALSMLLESPARPFAAIVGGAKVSDKIDLMRNMLGRIDDLLIGGAMAYTFLRARGVEVGASRVEEAKVEMARELMAEAEKRGVRIALPSDHVVAERFEESSPAKVTGGEAVESGWMGLDIGPSTQKRYAEILHRAATVFWNGPMGVFEWSAFAAGTLAVADAVASSGAHSLVGGGDSVAALAQSGRSGEISHISTGGGASLEFLEGKTLPGIAALEAKRGRSS
ncbi:MAG TPA: phosphoglycerate kinase [Candidatus Binatia bacterium]|nr:phosphoglycerate kinase [Candidatus Binatia bacterium]